MNINFLRIIQTSILLVLILSVSCKNDKNVKTERIKKDRLLLDSLYRIENLRVDYGDGRIEEVEIYISKNNDTITNQYKLYKNKQIDTSRSEFYDLKIFKTDKKNIYKGKISIHSKYDKLILNNRNSRTAEFHYWEQNADSIRLTSLKSESSNTIEFEYENYYSNHLQGIITLSVWIDPNKGKRNDEDILTHYMLELLVDSHTITDNYALKVYGIDKEKPFNKNKLRLIKAE